ncbi:DUF4065 domain-containing protein [Macrococcus capreoli]|uniref:type II TA system antitoxin MqsA family protein n=1 Tax=Macrococcus capreoli TaxID=2982690 RepID=UPI003EE60BE2
MNTYIKRDKETFKVRDEDIQIESEFRFSLDTNEKVFDEQLDNIAINKAFNVYRAKNDLLGNIEIREIREKYQLSQRDFAQITGLGKATISRYEKGALPSKVNNNLYKNIDRNVEEMKLLFERNKNKVDEKVQIKLQQRLYELESGNSVNELSSIENYFIDNDLNLNNGYHKFDIRKFEDVISFFYKHIPMISKTKLNKLLFYSDFIYFNQYVRSITGTTYIKNHYGPVPYRSELLYGLLAEEEIIQWKPFINGAGEYLVSNKALSIENFTEEEINVLNHVVALFKHDTATEISEKSHEELGWQETNIKDVIPYHYAIQLKYK